MKKVINWSIVTAGENKRRFIAESDGFTTSCLLLLPTRHWQQQPRKEDNPWS